MNLLVFLIYDLKIRYNRIIFLNINTLSNCIEITLISKNLFFKINKIMFKYLISYILFIKCLEMI